jgi:uncharacterized protein (TIGR03437 family)
MHLRAPIFATLIFVAAARAATFGTVTAPSGGAAYTDIVLDERQQRLYLVNNGQSRIDVYNIRTRAFLSPIATDLQPVSAAISTDGNTLYVTCYAASALDLIDLTRNIKAGGISLPSSPEGVAVGGDGRVLVSTISAGSGPANTLLIYDPSQGTGSGVQSVVVAPPPPASPVLPPPNNRVFNSYRSHLATSGDGKTIVGINITAATTEVIFVYEVASGTVLRSRTATNVSSVIAVSPDGSKFMAGPVLFDTQTLQVLAQENAGNAPFAFPAGAAGNFNTQQNQGGSVFTPDGGTLYAAFNMAPVGATRANTTQLLVNDPDNLLIRYGLQLPENMTGKMVVDAAGANIYALSDSGFTTIPIGTAANFAIAVPDLTAVLLTSDICGVFAGQNTASSNVSNLGRGRYTAAIAPYTPSTTTTVVLPGPPGIGPFPITPTPAPAAAGPIPAASVTNTGTGATLNFRYTSTANANPGTTGPSDFVVTSAEAINIPGNVHVFQNNRDPVSTGTVLPVNVNAVYNSGLTDIYLDTPRQHIIIANSGMNRLEVFDMATQKFLAAIKVGQMPRGIAAGTDGRTIYVANSGGESVSIVDLVRGAQTGRVSFPAFPLNAAVGVITPAGIAASQHGPQMIMSDGSFWRIDGGQAIPRALPTSIFASTARAIGGGNPAFWTMASTPGGEYIIVMTGTGNAYLYDAVADDFTLSKTVLATPLTGYMGPVTAGPGGNYYSVGGTILNASLTPVLGGTNGTSPSGRWVAAAAPVSNNQIALFTEPVRASATAAVTDAGLVEIYDTVTGVPVASGRWPEGPSAALGTGANARVSAYARTMVVDAAQQRAYALTASGLSVIATAAAAVNPASQPSINPKGIVGLGDYTAALAPGGLLTIFGRNLAGSATANPPYPTLMGGACVTLNNQPLPLSLTSAGQINAQVPVNQATGTFPLIVRNITAGAATASTNVAITKYAPEVMIGDGKQAAIIHADGSLVTADNPAVRDEKLTIYAIGLGPVKGVTLVTGQAAPATPAGVTDTIQVYFGNPAVKQSQMIVNSSTIAPGLVGVYQIGITVPGAHLRGKALPVTLKIDGVSSSTTGPAAPTITVN